MRIALILFLMTLLGGADETNRKLQMIFVKSEHCIWCRKMEHEIFDNPEIRKRLEKEYHIRIITKEKMEIPEKLSVKYFPTTFALSSDGKEILDSLAGYRQRDKFLRFFHDTYIIANSDDDTL